jgi:hypothetical protein
MSSYAADIAQASGLPVWVASLSAVLDTGLWARGSIFESPQKLADGVLQLDPLIFGVARPCVLQPVRPKDLQVRLEPSPEEQKLTASE